MEYVVAVFALLALMAYFWSQNCKRKFVVTKNIASLKCVPLLGHLHYLFNPAWKGAGQMTTVLHYIFALAKIFDSEDLFSVSIFKRKVVILKSAASAEALLRNRDELNKSLFYDSIKSAMGNSILLRKGDETYHRRRKIMSAIFLSKNFKKQDENMKFYALALLRDIENTEDLTRVDMSKLFTHYTFNVAFDLCISSHRKLRNKSMTTAIEQIERIVEIMSDRMFMPWLYSDFIFFSTAMGKEFQKLLKFLFDYLQELIDDSKLRKTSRDKNKDATSIHDLVQGHLGNAIHCFTEREIIQEIFTVVIAAYDTSRSTLEWAVFLVGHNPRVQAKIHLELDEVLGSGDATNEDHLTWDHISKLKYLKCVIKEAMRLYPPIPIVARKLSQDIDINGITIPEGTDVAVVISYIHRSDKYFENPELFHPERFESGDIHRFAFIPFSSGSRNCFGNYLTCHAGSAFAYRSMMTVLARIFFKYTVKSVEREDSVLTKSTIVQRADRTILLQLEPRKKYIS